MVKLRIKQKSNLDGLSNTCTLLVIVNVYNVFIVTKVDHCINNSKTGHPATPIVEVTYLGSYLVAAQRKNTETNRTY